MVRQDQTEDDEVEVFTHVKLDTKNGHGIKSEDKVLPNSRSTAPKNASPWITSPLHLF